MTNGPARPRTFDEALAALAAARGPSDLFGGPGTDAATRARRYRRLARLLHPDTAPPGRRAEAETACARLNSWRTDGGSSATLETGRHRFAPGGVLAHGDLAVLRRARCTPLDGRGPALDAVLKVPRSAIDNDLMAREARALRRLGEHGEPRLRAYVPTLLDSFLHDDATGTGAGAATGSRRVNALLELEGFVPLTRLMDAWPDGLDARDAAWIWRRLLVALGFAHRAGVRHGAVLPEHVMVHLAEHGVVLVDWCYSVTGPDAPLPALVERHRSLYPPEVPARRPATEATDLHMAALCMAALMGAGAPDALRAFVAGCTLPAEARRPHDAWRLLAELDELLERLYGPRTFRPLRLPANAT